MSFDCISECQLGGKCDNKHCCAFCNGHMHVICGELLDEDHPKWTMTCSCVCKACHRGSNNNINTKENDKEDEDSDEEITLAQLGQKHAAAAPPKASAKKRRNAPAAASPKKKKKRFERPASDYLDDPTQDAAAWTFPTDKPEYLSAFVEFMNFIDDNKGYTKYSAFTKARLLKIQPKHVLAFLTHKAFGKTKRQPEDRPVYARSNHVKNIKMKISYFMPSGSPWVDLSDGMGNGNPTRHKSINKLIADIIQFEI